MSEEEKKAIERIKQEIDRYKAIETPKEVYITDIKILLSLIKKQQKEIEDLKDKNTSLQKEVKLMKSININDNYISKDKIREKIKELEDLQENQYIHLEYTKKILLELLEG